MKRLVIAAAAATAALTAVGGAWVWNRSEGAKPMLAAEPSGPVLYYRDPDGKPSYSPTPMKTSDGRDFIAVRETSELTSEASKHKPEPGGSRKIKYYRNPMGLPDTSPVPKKDSMGMDYIAVFEGEDTDDGSVSLSPGKIQRTGVKSEPAALRAIRPKIRAPGTIQLDERRVSIISIRTESWVQKVSNVTTGSVVKKGEPLMEIYSSEIARASAEYVSTMTSKITSGEGPLGRGSRQRLMNLDVPEDIIVSMEKNKVAPISIEWTAPRDGIVLERKAIEGMRAQPGDVLFRVADVSVVWAMADVAERDLGLLAVGQPVIVKARSFGDREFTGKVDVIYPQVNRETRTARIRIELPNPDTVLLPDMYVDAEIDTGSPNPVIAIPESAVMDTGSRQAVLVDKGEGRFEPRAVKLGARGDGYVEVREGVTEGEPVVVSANFLIDAESNLKAALKGFSDTGDQR